MNRSAEREQRFRTVYADAYDDVLRFVQRRASAGDAGATGSAGSAAANAEDIVAETMLTAWRRVDDLPVEHGDARAWLFGIARNCLLNHRRAHRRQNALGVRLAYVAASATTPEAAESIAGRIDLAAAWSRLTPAEQEVLALTVFDGLTSRQAGAVLGITPEAFRLRVARARGRLRRRLEGAAYRPGPAAVPSEEMHR